MAKGLPAVYCFQLGFTKGGSKVRPLLYRLPSAVEVPQPESEIL